MEKISETDLIKISKLILIDENGENLGECSGVVTIEKANEKNLDVVIVQRGDTPIIKLMNYDKFLYKEKKKKKHQISHSKTKEVKFRLSINDHDLNIKIGQIEKFIAKKDKVKINIEIKNSRERERFEKIEEFAKEIIGKISIDHKIESFPSYDGSKYFQIVIC